MNCHQRLFPGNFLVIDPACERVGLQRTVYICKALKWIGDAYSPVETGVKVLVLVYGYVGDNVVDFQIHVLYILEEILHLGVVPLLKRYFSEPCLKGVLITLDDHPLIVLIGNLWVVNLKSVNHIVYSGVLQQGLI